jgi:hypothetical protein
MLSVLDVICSTLLNIKSNDWTDYPESAMSYNGV